MTGEIDVDECVEDKKSWFAVKRFRIGGTAFRRPIKTLDVKGLTQDIHRAAGSGHGFVLSEATKVIQTVDDIDRIQAEDVDAKINAFFYKKKWLGVPTVVNITLNFNPVERSSRVPKKWNGFFDMCYQYSNPFLTVPNIRASKTIRRQNIRIIDVKDYIRFVDYAFDILDTKDSKAIFVPISLRFSVKSLSLLMDHYLSKDRLCFWFDFEGKAISEVSMSRIAHVLRLLRDSKNLSRSITYFTNIKREISSNNGDPKSPASDVLASLTGAAIVGSNREPQCPPPSAGLQEVPMDHKTRVFDPESYYYVKAKGGVGAGKTHNTVANSVRLDNELASQTDSFFKHSSMVPSMETKEMLRVYRDGDIFKALTTGLSDGSFSSYL